MRYSYIQKTNTTTAVANRDPRNTMPETVVNLSSLAHPWMALIFRGGQYIF